mgnify:CR=1 FL=1
MRAARWDRTTGTTVQTKALRGLVWWVSTSATLACGDDTTSADGRTDGSTSGESTDTTTSAATSAGSSDDATSDDATGGSLTTGDPATTADSSTGMPGPQCGDGTLDTDETCDDGNDAGGDGCSATCAPETGFTCDDASPSVCTATCGDGLVAGEEQCDDGDAGNDDGCGSTCQVEPGWSCGGEPSLCTTGCGDGVIAGAEGCDDGDREDGDGCSARCSLEPLWECTGEPSLCTTECGDANIVGPEECDDADTLDADGCSATCLVETGWTCTGEPSTCATTCGDGIAAGAETCDGGGLASGDGCAATCDLEFGWACDTMVPNQCTLVATLAEVTLGGEGGCVRTTAGDVGCFGVNSEGQVGNGTTGVRTDLPTFALAGASAIASGDEHVCALVVGDVWCWGDNLNEQLGPGAAPGTDETTPILVTGLPADMAEVEGGFDHTCAIDSVGGVWCWGDNDNRQLGRGGTSTIDDPVPGLVALPGALAATDLGLGENHSCAVLEDETVACWGDDDSGQLGDGASGVDGSTAALVTGLTGIVDVDAGRDTTCAIDTLGTVTCWGNNDDGEVGNDVPGDVATPQTLALPAAADAISLGTDFSCALLTNDEVYCWGEGNDYQLGDGDLISRSAPVAVQGLPAGDLVDLEAGANGVCVVRSNDERWCWGHSEEGQLGMAPREQLEPGGVLAFSGPLASLTLDRFEYRGVTCGVLTNGTLECAGDATLVSATPTTGAGGFFAPITHHLTTPTPIAGLTDVLEVGMGDGFVCVRTSTDVRCWGDNSNRQLGQGGTSTADLLVPTPVVGLGTVDELEVGDQFACVRTGGTVQCWGDNDDRQTGDAGATGDQSLPVTVMGLVDAVDIELGEDFACALRTGGVVSCWGDDLAGQLGDDDGATSDSAVPVDVTGLPGPVDQIALGLDHACALAADQVYCWGDGAYGQIGQGTEDDWDTARHVPGLPAVIVEVASGGNFSCAISDVGQMWCWGDALDGQLGNGGPTITANPEEPSPVPFEVATGIGAVALGNSHTCIDTGAGWQCLGFRSAGQLADGTTVMPSFPTPMLFGL